MVKNFLRLVGAERLKQKRNLTPWLLFGAASFVPLIVFLVRSRHRADLPKIYAGESFWLDLWKLNWESIALLILPIVTILSTSLILQVEDRNNAWKQVHASPQPWAATYLAKLAIVLGTVVQFIILVHLVIYLSGLLPAWLFPELEVPSAAFPWEIFARRSWGYFVDSLPVVALQFFLALRFRNLLGPVGVGLGIWVLSLGMLNTSINYLIPTSYSGMDYLVDTGYKTFPNLPLSVRTLALGYFLLFAAAGLAHRRFGRDHG
jgi:hypothetical protein